MTNSVKDIKLSQWLEITNLFNEPELRQSNLGRERLIVMMPLNLAEPGEENLIHRVGGSPEVKKHLEDLGFVAGGTVTVVSVLGGNVIAKVKESRVAISEEMARKIMVA